MSIHPWNASSSVSKILEQWASSLIEISNLKYKELEGRLAQEWRSLQSPPTKPFIVDACEQVRGRKLILKVSAATGLTPTEAERMGIEYAPLETVA